MRRLALFVTACALPVVAAAAPTMKPGLWEITTSVDMAGMPGGMPPTTVKHCYRPDDVKDLRGTVPEQNKSCKVTDWKEAGNTVSWKMRCGGDTPMTGTGTITYAGDSYSGTNTMTMSEGGMAMTMTYKYRARRLGNCP